MGGRRRQVDVGVPVKANLADRLLGTLYASGLDRKEM
jgi:hypothetical protein